MKNIRLYENFNLINDDINYIKEIFEDFAEDNNFI